MMKANFIQATNTAFSFISCGTAVIGQMGLSGRSLNVGIKNWRVSFNEYFHRTN